MPDWRDPTQYPSKKKLSNHGWAWEFLRRNPDYRTDFAAAIKRWKNEVGEFDPNLEQEQALKDGVIPDLLLGTQIHQRVDDPDFVLRAAETRKWFLRDGLLNPHCEKIRRPSFVTDLGRVYFFKPATRHFIQPAGRYHGWIPIDLRLPISLQLSAAKLSIENAQKNFNIKSARISHHRRLWPHYLRLLDADLDGRTPKQIADTLSHEPDHDGLDEKQIWDQLRSARKMTKPSGYRTIFLVKS